MEEYNNDKNKIPTIKQLQQSFNNINNDFQATTSTTNDNNINTSSSTTSATTYKVFDISNDYLNDKIEIQTNSIHNNNIKEENEKTIPLPIYKITAQQYMEIVTQFRQHSLQYADQILFPWLHGVDGNDYQQNLFFSVKGGKMKIPNYRGHVLIHANEMYPTIGRLIESFLPQEILMNGDSDNDDPSFISSSPPQFKTLSKQENQGIHLRQFKIQPYRYASISDIFIYGGNSSSNGSNHHQQKLLDIAKKFAQAHYYLYHQRQLHHEKLRKTGGKRAIVNANQLVYRTFIITDGVDTFEKKYPELVWYSSNGMLMNDFSFLDRERIEMQKITSCTEITKNIWVGNTQDAPMSTDTDDLMGEDDELQQQQNNDDEDNPNQFSVCIECHDLADMPSPSILTLAKETLNELAPNELPSDIIHLDMYSTASNIMTTEISHDQLNQFLSDFIHLLQFMEDLVQVYDRRILLHCSDGYTESSILALSWIMFHQKISLPEAYIYFQEKRNFFIISTDVPLLKHIEQFIQSYHLHHQQQQQSSSSIIPSPQPSTSSSPTSLNLQKRKRGDESLFEASESSSMNNINDNHMKLHPSKKNDIFQQQQQQQHSVHQRVLLSDQYINTISNTDTDLKEDNNFGNNNNVEEDEDTLVDDYILSSDYSSSVMNTTTNNTTTATAASLPMNESTSTVSSTASSIASTTSSMSLSSLLLASSSPPSPTQLQTYPWFYSPRFEGSFPSRIMPFLYLGNLNHATNPTMLKTLGITHVVSVGENADLSTNDFRLLFLDNLYDDGIDSIKTSYRETMAFIDEACNQGTKCLIHCRVGVSRSAAVTICYVMHHLHMSLVEAYIFVRTRRLNVIIQPNLKFMFEMLQLEQQSKGQFQISWPALCHEIYLLNQSYSDE
ncbi:unnamed protein product [Cunninghamella echinulata]